MPSSTLQRERLARRAMAATTSPVVIPTPSVNYNRQAVSYVPAPRVNLKTSITHPINVSWIVPEELVGRLSDEPLSPSLDLFDVYTNTSLYERYLSLPARSGIASAQTSSDQQSDASPNRASQQLGNLALSSCPGKKVRLSGPVRGRATINRDLELDFQRLKELNISVIVCCLNDQELEFLGVPWSRYNDFARQYELTVIRIPMIEGSVPDTLEQLDQVVVQMDEYIESGRNILAHCRGGVGRAGLVACCWLLNRLFCCNAERSIQFVRMRRSPKAIETMQQVDFIMQYAQYIRWRVQQAARSRDVSNTTANPSATTTTTIPNPIPTAAPS